MGARIISRHLYSDFGTRQFSNRCRRRHVLVIARARALQNGARAILHIKGEMYNATDTHAREWKPTHAHTHRQYLNYANIIIIYSDALVRVCVCVLSRCRPTTLRARSSMHRFSGSSIYVCAISCSDAATQRVEFMCACALALNIMRNSCRTLVCILTRSIWMGFDAFCERFLPSSAGIGFSIIKRMVMLTCGKSLIIECSCHSSGNWANYCRQLFSAILRYLL